ncbi:hypothetical protein K435DRAFT_867433 [Dendrothele bispora CBS 962.96]|uniref:Retrotransposon gag domain-containing protein n=1 Tax=Dendrothele bispora (strain CBS 962.96) TaxID=1314807 RepID=A0A4S8LE97_DENBC|nr:hypothetical protein K435DRAFT_867433 [Dendrothele bispora CBS 962.96]
MVERTQFSGDIDEKINSKDFLRTAESQLLTMGVAEAKFAKKVTLFFKAGSRVDTWYEELNQEVKDGDWDKFSSEFLKEFPSTQIAKPTEFEHRKELLACRITVEELGTRDEDTQEWTHHRFARKLFNLAKAAKIAGSSSDIIAVHENLPRMIRGKVKEDAKDWEEFTESIRKLEVRWIKDRKEEEKGSGRWRQSWPQRSQTPANRTGSNEDVFNATGGGRSNFAAPVYPRRQIPSLNETQKTTLRANVDMYKQKPNTSEGIEEWKRDLVNFFTTWGSRNPQFNERMVYPYTPGTLKPGSGECFKCGRAWHGKGGECPPGSGSIPVNEGHWRAFVQRELGYPKAAQVNVVGEEDNEWMLLGFEQGNGEGSTA